MPPTPHAATLLLLLGVLASPVARAVPEETPSLAGEHATLLALEKVSGAIYAADVTSNQSRATQLAWGPGPDPSKTNLYLRVEQRARGATPRV